MEPRIQYAKTSDGVNIAYYVIGGGKPLVFVPAGPMTHIQLDWQSAQRRDFHSALAEGRSLVRYDGRGSGLSDENAEPLLLDACLFDLDAVVDALQLEHFSLLAPLSSGPPAIAYAARNPERVSDLILWCTSARNAEVLSSPGDRALGALREADWHLYTEVISFILYGWDADAGPAYAKRVRETSTPEKYRRRFSEIHRLDASTELGNVQARTLVMQRGPAGSGEGVRAGRTLAAGIPNAELLVLEGEPGTITGGDTAATIAAINEFLCKGEARQSARPTAGDVHTILFTDMESSTALTQRLGDAGAQELVRAHNIIVREALHAHGGGEIKHTGDGIMASFPSASSALECAVAIQRAIGKREEEPLLSVRIGLNAGEPIAEDQDLFGTAVQLARRICDRAAPGEILASNVVRELAAGKGFLFSDRGEVVPKGFDEAVRLYEVRWREEG